MDGLVVTDDDAADALAQPPRQLSRPLQGRRR
jgi:hypothetical protein